jgi:hypothetical protein
MLMAKDGVIKDAVCLKQHDGGLFLLITTIGVVFIRMDLFRPVSECLRDTFLRVILRNAQHFIKVDLHHQTIYYYTITQT